jgi:hypothetical protein
MTGYGRSFALLTALGMVLICGVHDPQGPGAPSPYRQTTQAAPSQDLAFAILKTLMVRKIGALETGILAPLQETLEFPEATPRVVPSSREMAVNR